MAAATQTWSGMTEGISPDTGKRALAATALTSSSTSCRPPRMEGNREGSSTDDKSWEGKGHFSIPSLPPPSSPS